MNLTPTQQRFYDLLKDGRIHYRPELVALLWDEATVEPGNAITAHLTNMRPKLSTLGLDVIARSSNGTTAYRLVRFISPGE